MLKTPVLKQKQAGIILITLGGFLFAFIFLFLYFNVIRVAGFPELLPSKETIGFIEFPVALEDPFPKKINEVVGVEWNKDVIPWAAEKAAVAFLKNPDQNSEKLFSFLLIQTRSTNEAFLFLKNFRNPKKELREVKINGRTAFSTSALHFAFLSDVLVVAPTAQNLAVFLSRQTASSQHLSSDSDFIQIRSNLFGAFFVYAKPREVPPALFSSIASMVPQMPFLTFSFPSLGIAAEKQNSVWRGKSYALVEKNLPTELIQPYRAALLPFLPADADFIISGQNLIGQLKKIDMLLPPEMPLPKIMAMMKRFLEENLTGMDFEKDISPLVAREFGITVRGDRVLFVTEIPADPAASEKIQAIKNAFQKTSGRLTPKPQEIILPDGTKAQELVPDPSKVKLFEEAVGGIAIHGFLLGKNGAVYDATVAGKWYISNDFETVKKAVQLTKEPSKSLRESSLYKESLQPILQNPELIGIAVLPQGTFSFSKRTVSDRMEVNFMWRK